MKISNIIIAFFAFAAAQAAADCDVTQDGDYTKRVCTQRFDNVPKGRTRTLSSNCESNEIFVGFSCAKSSDKFSIRAQNVNLDDFDGITFTRGIACTVKSNKIRVSTTVTSTALCLPANGFSGFPSNFLVVP